MRPRRTRRTRVLTCTWLASIASAAIFLRRTTSSRLLSDSIQRMNRPGARWDRCCWLRRSYDLARTFYIHALELDANDSGRPGVAGLHTPPSWPHRRGRPIPRSRWRGALVVVPPNLLPVCGARSVVTEVVGGARIPPDSVVRTTLSNGLTVLVRQDTSAPVVAIVTNVSAGYFDEPDDVAGIAHVLEHMYFKGTPTRGVGEIARRTKAVGGILNASTIYDHTSYYTVLPASSVADGLEVQADAYANSLIDADELARELEVIIQEAKRKADNPSAVAIETLYEVLHDAHRIRRWRIGREPGLRALTRANLVGFYRNFYHPANTTLSVVGDVDPDLTLRRVADLYGSLPAGTPVRSPGPSEAGVPGFRYREWSGDIGRTQLAFGWRTPGTLHADTAALDLLAVVLGTGRASRLYRAVRERRLASDVSSFNYTPTDLGVFVVHAETAPETTTGAARAIWSQLASARRGDISETELVRAKRIFESRWVRRLEDMEGQANYLAEWQALGDWQLGDEYLDRYLSVSRDDAHRVARRWLDPLNVSTIVYRPSGAPAVAADTDAWRALLESGHVEGLDLPDSPHVPPPASRASARPTLEREESGVRVYRGRNGIPILIRTKRGAPLVHAGLFITGGASQESEETAGLTTLMARTAIKGTRLRSASQIAEDAEMLGGSITPMVGGESFGWSISVPSTRAASAVELLGDVVQRPVFDADALERERAAAIAQVIAVRDDMYRYPMRLAAQAAFPGHPYGIPVSGTEASLNRVTPTDLEEWHRGRAMVGASAIVIVGGGDPDALAAIAEQVFGELASGASAVTPPPSWPTTAAERVERRDRAQTALAVLFPGPSRSDPDRVAAEMIVGVASGLGGRLFEQLRDKQSLCYTVNASVSQRVAGGVFACYVATSPDKEDAARSALLAELERLRDAPVTSGELARAQTYAIGTTQIRRQSGAALLGEVADAWLFGHLGEIGDREHEIRAVTADQMQRLAERCLDATRRVEGVVRGASPEMQTP